MKTPHDPAGLAAFLRERLPPIFYVSTVPYNLLGLRRWVDQLSFVSAGDCLDGALPGAATPDLDPGDDPDERVSARLLADPSVRRFVASRGPGGKALFLMLDEGTVAAARAAGLEVWLPDAALRRRLDDKIAGTRLCREIGVRTVPHALGRVDGYPALRRLGAGLGADLVVQLPFGDSGQTTFFISDASDYARHAAAIEAAPEVKVMRRIRCRPAAIEGCVTGRGVVAGPLAAELVGFPALTPHRGGWCGNEVGAGLFPSGVAEEARAVTRRFGARLGELGYRGVFGLDFLLDEDRGDLYLGEVNPRITGLTPLSTWMARERDTVPLLVLHLLEWAGVNHDLDLADIDARLGALEGARGASQLIIKQTAAAGRVDHAPRSGIWRLGAGGQAHFARPAADPAEIAADDEALLVRCAHRGRARSRGACLSRILAPGRMLSLDHHLSPRAESWIQSVLSAFEPPRSELIA